MTDVIGIARIMRPRSMSRELSGTIREILGTCQSVGCTVDGEAPHDLIDKVQRKPYSARAPSAAVVRRAAPVAYACAALGMLFATCLCRAAASAVFFPRYRRAYLNPSIADPRRRDGCSGEVSVTSCGDVCGDSGGFSRSGCAAAVPPSAVTVLYHITTHLLRSSLFRPWSWRSWAACLAYSSFPTRSAVF